VGGGQPAALFPQLGGSNPPPCGSFRKALYEGPLPGRSPVISSPSCGSLLSPEEPPCTAPGVAGAVVFHRAHPPNRGPCFGENTQYSAPVGSKQAHNPGESEPPPAPPRRCSADRRVGVLEEGGESPAGGWPDGSPRQPPGPCVRPHRRPHRAGPRPAAPGAPPVGAPPRGPVGRESQWNLGHPGGRGEETRRP